MFVMTHGAKAVSSLPWQIALPVCLFLIGFLIWGLIAANR